MNIYRFYNESPEKDFIENNLSRAFAICLLNDTLFLNECLKSILTKDDFDFLFTSISDQTNFTIDLQVDTANIDKESFTKVYAVATTTNKSLNMDDFFNQPDFGEKKNITDIFISIKDIAIVIEVKRTDENCKAQLYNQVLPFVKDNSFQVLPIRLSWQDIIKQMEKIYHLQSLVENKSIFIRDFLNLSEIRFPSWFEPKPFNALSFSTQQGTIQYTQLEKRMRQILIGSKHELLDYADRLGIAVSFGWANEILIGFESYKNEKSGQLEDFVSFCIYPGNTKQQGKYIYDKELEWKNSNSLRITNNEYELSIRYHLKFCHFNKFVSGLWFEKNDLIKEIATAENYNHKSGKWDRVRWNEFEKFMDEHLKIDFDWRKECKWLDSFMNTDRNYFTFSIGFEVATYVTYSKFKEIDKKDDDIQRLTKFVEDVAEGFKKLI